MSSLCQRYQNPILGEFGNIGKLGQELRRVNCTRTVKISWLSYTHKYVRCDLQNRTWNYGKYASLDKIQDKPNFKINFKRSNNYQTTRLYNKVMANIVSKMEKWVLHSTKEAVAMCNSLCTKFTGQHHEKLPHTMKSCKEYKGYLWPFLRENIKGYNGKDYMLIHDNRSCLGLSDLYGMV